MNYLKISYFKCFEDASIFLNRLTVMAGANGNGKSTAIQALLFLRQTIEQCAKISEGKGYTFNDNSIGQNIPLNGNYCLSLGDSSFVLNNNNNNENIISVAIEDENRFFEFGYEADNIEPQLFLKVKSFEISENCNLPVLSKEFYYLNAERIGPRIKQGLQFYGFPNAGFQGEFVAQLMSEKGGFFPVEEGRLKKGTTNPGIQFQVNEWLQSIMPDVKVTVKQNAETQTSQVQIENVYTKGQPTLATNLGFGISYVLPIIATGLIAKKGSYFIVENPEAHLHPSAQSKIGEFLGMVASTGVNVIIETHSDHIINGIQLSVAEKVLSYSGVTLNFFNSVKGVSQPDVLPISIKESGELSEWPKGFFDQTQQDYSRLFNLNK